MVGETKINYAASKMQPSAIAPQPMEIRIATPAEELEKEETVTELKQPTAKKKAAAKPAAKRGRGRPAGSKNKVKKAKPTSAAKKKKKKITAKKPNAKKTSSAKSNNKSSAKTESFAQNNEAINAAMESNSATAKMTQTMTEEMMKFANKNFSENMTLSKEFFSCRTMSDMFEIQNKMMKNNFDSFFKQSSKMSEMLFKAASESATPLSGPFTNMADEFKKKFSA